ncbi:MAG TPA: GntR family transcriptional regulator [Microlunatus sp.]
MATEPVGSPAIGGVSRKGLRDQVYDSVLELLMSHVLKPGERLGIDSLAHTLKVSPTPVREALVHLERTGLVTREGYKGYRVAAPLSEREMTELVDAREMLEVQATQWAGDKLTAALPDLRLAHALHTAATVDVLERLRTEHVDLQAYRDYFVADERFHQEIMKAAGNRFLTGMATDLGAHQHRMRQTIIRGEYDVAQALAEHAAILAAVESGDQEATVQAMRDHMAGIRARSAHGFNRTQGD